MPTRRDVIGAVGTVAIAAGCLDGSEPEPVPGVAVEISVVDHVPEEVPVSFELDQASTRLDDGTLPRFSFGMINVHDGELSFEDAAPGLLRAGPSDPEGLAVVTEEEAERIETGQSDAVVEAVGECLAVDRLPARDTDDWMTTLVPDEPTSEDFAFVPVDAPADGCPESGDYTFRMDYDFYEADATDEDPQYTVDWGFTVRVRDD